MSALPQPDLNDEREVFYARADTQHLAPLWTRLKSLVPAAPTPRWACRTAGTTPTCGLT